MPSSDPDDLINHPLANLINSTQKCFDLFWKQTSFKFYLPSSWPPWPPLWPNSPLSWNHHSRKTCQLIFDFLFSLPTGKDAWVCVCFYKKTLELYHISSFNSDGTIICEKIEKIYLIFSLKVWSWILRRKYSEAFYYDERSTFWISMYSLNSLNSLNSVKGKVNLCYAQTWNF